MIRRIAPAVALLMPIAVLLLMLRRAVNVPFLDEWSWAELSVALHRGTLTWAMIAAQHNEHRNVVANLVFLGIDRAIGWNILAEQLASFALLVVAQAAAWVLVRETTVPARRWVLFGVISVLLWSLAQWENFALGYNIGWNVCTAALFVLLASFAARIDVARLMLAALAAFVATFASAQGALLFPIGFALIAAHVRGRILGLIVWSAVTIVTAALFLHGYDATFGGGTRSAVAAVPYALAVLGTPIGAWWGFAACAAVGAFGLAGYWILSIRSAAEPVAQRVWWSAAFYAIANALFITASRVQLGPDSALSSHYAALSLFLFVAVAGLAASVWEWMAAAPRWALIAAGVVIAYGVLDADLHGNRAWQLYAIARHDEVCALVRHDDAALVTLADADTAGVEREAAALAAVNDVPYRDLQRSCLVATPPR